ncbi:MAG: hypothetical protein OEQ53_01935 [Saprospiraceae bacterium]|nr:hypothetical protein [Saprospiraceae bacterium]
MKVRIDEKSLRCGLTEKDVQLLITDGTLTNVVPFPNGRSLYYIINTHTGGEMFTTLQIDGIRLFVPATQCVTWAHSDEISMYSQNPLPKGGNLELIIEKNLPCFHKQTGKSQTDLAANPNQKRDSNV